MLTDEGLMLQFQSGSQEALDELFTRYRTSLYGFFFRRLLNPATAQELTQETFLALIRARSRYQPRSAFRTYLFGIALKLVAVEARAVARRRHPPASPWPLSGPSTSDPIEQTLYLRDAIAKLDRIDREILLLREFEDLSYAEIATLLHFPLNTVRSRLFRARVALRNLLAPAGDLCQ